MLNCKGIILLDLVREGAYDWYDESLFAKGQVEGLDMKIVAGHVGTAEIAGDRCFHDTYYDGASHYYIDGSTPVSGYVPVLMVDTEKDEYYTVTESGFRLVEAYENRAGETGRE